MPVNLSIRNVPDDIADRLRARAVRNHRSVQGELMAMIEAAAAESVQAAGLSETSIGYRDEPVDEPARSTAKERTTAELHATKDTGHAAKVPLRWPSEATRLVRDSHDIDGAFEETPQGMQRMRRLTASEVLVRARARNIRTPGSITAMIRQMRDER